MKVRQRKVLGWLLGAMVVVTGVTWALCSCFRYCWSASTWGPIRSRGISSSSLATAADGCRRGVEIRAADLTMLLDGVDRVKRQKRYRRPASATPATPI